MAEEEKKQDSYSCGKPDHVRSGKSWSSPRYLRDTLHDQWVPVDQDFQLSLRSCCLWSKETGDVPLGGRRFPDGWVEGPNHQHEVRFRQHPDSASPWLPAEEFLAMERPANVLQWTWDDAKQAVREWVEKGNVDFMYPGARSSRPCR